jgi:hypothetical protein
VRKLKRGKGRVGLTGKGAGRDEVSFAVAETVLGRIPNSSSRMNDHGWEWMRWLRNDLAQLPMCSIYRKSERWPRILRRTRGSRRWKKALATVNPWLTAWQPPRRRWDGPTESRRRGGKAKPRGAQPGGGGHRRANLFRRKVKEKATGSHRSDLQLTVGEDPYPAALSIHPARES